MRVSVSNVRSAPRQVKCGVPQGSVLGPLLFLLYVNCLPSLLKSKCKVFADDLKIYMKVRYSALAVSAADLSSVQSDVNKIAVVARSWGLDLNVNKCCFLRFERGHGRLSSGALGSLCRYNIWGRDIPKVDTARDLGVLVDRKFKFHDHVQSQVSKASGLSFNILRSTVCRSRDFMMALYIAHIRPVLEFSSSLWNLGYVGDMKLVESVQRRWTRQIDGLQDLSYAERLATLDLYSMKGRFLRHDLINYWKIFHSKSSILPEDIFVLAPQGRTRGHCYKVAHMPCSTEAKRRSFGRRCVTVWNGLPAEVVEIESLDAFKRALHSVLGQELFKFHD